MKTYEEFIKAIACDICGGSLVVVDANVNRDGEPMPGTEREVPCRSCNQRGFDPAAIWDHRDGFQFIPLETEALTAEYFQKNPPVEFGLF